MVRVGFVFGSKNIRFHTISAHSTTAQASIPPPPPQSDSLYSGVVKPKITSISLQVKILFLSSNVKISFLRKFLIDIYIS